jgi:hypothetical protein
VPTQSGFLAIIRCGGVITPDSILPSPIFAECRHLSNREIFQGFARSHLELPSLPGVNIFINLFFEHFSPQVPVLHHTTVDTNDDLLPPLLAAMIVIGAIQSRLPGTGRFSVVLLDIVRWNLQTAIECDNKLMREPMIIFAEALVCHAGIWCGNKHAFELAEIVRSMGLKHVRSTQFWRGNAKLVDIGRICLEMPLCRRRGRSVRQWRHSLGRSRSHNQ